MEDKQLAAALRAIVGDRFVLTDPAELRAYDCDGYTIERRAPRGVVLPANTAEVAHVVRTLSEARIPYIPRGAGTGLSGGAIPRGGEVIIGLARMNRLLELDLRNRRARVEAGHVNLRLTQRVRDQGFYFAPDPSSQSACTIGGNVAENSGGPHCLKYGVTTNHVLGLTYVTWDGEVLELSADAPGYDLVGLLIGSEGTMGIVTEITVQLLRRPQGVKTVLALFDSVRAASDAVSGIIARGIIPAALEMMDRMAIVAVERGNFPVGYPPGQEAVLLVEVDGLTAGLEAQAEAILAVCRAAGCTEVRVAQTETERSRWWSNRKTAFGAAGKLAPNYYVQDGVIPRSRLADVLGEIAAIGERYGLTIANVFHAGDGNLHPLICYDERIPGMVAKVVEAGSEILAACVRAGGSISGEHGIGIEKQADMVLVYGPDDLAVQQAVHDALDPQDLSNPGKLLP
ncbi:MAG TPA: FAD-linked oxidase C-terminal domain-containing protein, partial [Symbiobacteriaceae bacterium]|nr:FAD-linked oxidase C-terminal domain-containing protein [Symbiobacteriaceae bacterium]